MFSEAEGELQADGTGRLLLLERKTIGTTEKIEKRFQLDTENEKRMNIHH